MFGSRLSRKKSLLSFELAIVGNRHCVLNWPRQLRLVLFSPDVRRRLPPRVASWTAVFLWESGIKLWVNVMRRQNLALRRKVSLNHDKSPWWNLWKHWRRLHLPQAMPSGICVWIHTSILSGKERHTIPYWSSFVCHVSSLLFLTDHCVRHQNWDDFISFSSYLKIGLNSIGKTKRDGQWGVTKQNRLYFGD